MAGSLTMRFLPDAGRPERVLWVDGMKKLVGKVAAYQGEDS